MRSLGFQGRRLTQARKVRMLTQKSLAEMVGKSSQAIGQYESGKIEPTSDVVHRLADVLDVGVTFLYRPAGAPSSGSPIFYRSMSSATKRARDAVEYKLEWIDDIVSYFDERLDLPVFEGVDVDVPSNPLLIDNEMIERAATEVRREWNLGDGPIENVVGAMERNGIFVFRIPLGADSLDALSVDWNALHPYVVIGTDKGNAFRWRFDAAHELGHLVLHRSVTEESLREAGMNKALEAQAHRFASAFLMPEGRFLDSLTSVTLDSYKNIKLYWRCSIQAMVRRTKDLGIIGESDYRNLSVAISRRRWRSVEPFDDDVREERPALARKCLTVLRMSFEETEEDLYQRMCLPADFYREVFGSDFNSAPGCQARVYEFPSSR